MVTTHLHVLCKSVFWVFYHLLLCISLLHCITLSYLLNPCLIASTLCILFGSGNSVAYWHQPCLFLDETVRVSWYRKTLSGLSLYECWMIYFTPMDFSNDCSTLIIQALLRPQIFKKNLSYSPWYCFCFRPLHMLILNAAVMSPPYTVTEDGLELCYQVNCLSHHYLCRLLEKVLIRSAPSRIINVASESHR